MYSSLHPSTLTHGRSICLFRMYNVQMYSTILDRWLHPVQSRISIAVSPTTYIRTYVHTYNTSGELGELETDGTDGDIMVTDDRWMG